MLACPWRSICVGPTIAWRLPPHTLSKMREKPIHVSRLGSSLPRGPSGTGSRTSQASESVIISSVLTVSIASDAARRGTAPMPVASTSPSSAQASAAAQTMRSTQSVSLIACSPLSSEHGQCQIAHCLLAAHALQVLLLAAGDVALVVLLPAAGILGAGGVFLEVLHVEAIQRRARARVRTARHVHHAGGLRALPEHVARLPALLEEAAVDQLVAGDEGLLRGTCEQVVHVDVRAGDLAHAARIG